MTDVELVTEALIKKAENMPEVVQLPPEGFWSDIYEQSCLKFVETGEACETCKRDAKKIKDAIKFVEDNEDNEEITKNLEFAMAMSIYEHGYSEFKRSIVVLLACAHVGAVRVLTPDGEPVKEDLMKACFNKVLWDETQPNPISELLEFLEENAIKLENLTGNFLKMLEEAQNIDRDSN